MQPSLQTVEVPTTDSAFSQIYIPTKTIGIPSPSLTYPLRTSIRLIILNCKSQILLIHVTSDAYYKLPGGGLAPGESHQEAGIREALEETGCVVEMEEEPFAKTIEWRDEDCGKVQCQNSYCYRARLVKETGQRALTAEEIEDGFECEWVSVQEARGKLEGSRPDSEFGKFVREREGWFLDVFMAGDEK
jgi:8-oxo-dGTP diphosphatase